MKPDTPRPGPRAPLERKYANYFQIGHNAFEFILEFGQYHEAEEPRLHTGLVTTPAHAKALLRLLERSVIEHERDFGVIPEE